MVFMRNLFFALILLFLILCTSFAFAIDTKNLENVAFEKYLLNPLDRNEQVSVVAYSKVKCPIVYWVLPVSYNGTVTSNYIFIDDSDPSEFVDNGIARELIITINFFTSLGELHYNSQAANYLDAMSRDLSDYSYNLTLIKGVITDTDTSRQIEYIQEDITELQTDLKKTSTDVSNISELLIESNLSCQSKDSIILKSDNLDTETKTIDTKIQELVKNVSWIRTKLTDLNMSYQNKVYISDQINLPESVTRFPEQRSYYISSKEAIDKAGAKDKDFSIDLAIDAWKLKKERASFLYTYLSKDTDLKKKTKYETPKALYDHVLANKNMWENAVRLAAFNTNYDQMSSFLSKQEYSNAKSKITLLNTIAADVVKSGFRIIDEEETKDYTIYVIYAVIAIAILLLIPKLFSIIKGSIKKEDKKEPEVNIDLPN